MTVLRRTLVIGGTAIVGGGALIAGGSAAFCALQPEDQAMLRPLFIAVPDIPSPERIGGAVLAVMGPGGVRAAITARSDLVGATLIARGEDRRRALARSFRTDFAKGNTLVADRWVVSHAEALIAAAWVS